MNSQLVFKQLVIIYKRYKKILLPSFSLLLLICGYFLFLNKHLDIYMQNIELSKALNLRLIQAEKILDASKIYEKQIIELNQAEKNLISLALPEKPDYSSLIIHLTSLAKKSGFFVNSIDIEDLGIQSTKENSNKSIGKLLIKIKLVGGGYNELKNMINLLQESIMMNDIYSINFSNKNPIYELSLIVYYDNLNLIKK